jgi:hypothetical protein
VGCGKNAAPNFIRHLADFAELFLQSRKSHSFANGGCRARPPGEVPDLGLGDLRLG